MQAPLLSVIIITRDRQKDLVECLKSVNAQRDVRAETIVIDDCSASEISSVVRSVAPEARTLRATENLGVPEARNWGIREARGEILVFIDDDAVFGHEHVLAQTVEHFSEKPAPGILAFRIVDYYTNEIRPHEFPHTDVSKADQTFETTYFVGCGAAIHRRVFEEIGTFFGDYFYGLEESDFSWRALRRGFEIRYVPDLVVRHKATPDARPSWRKIYYQTRNRLWFTFVFLPPQFILTHAAVWMPYFLVQSVRTGQVTAFTKGVVDGLRGLPALRWRRRQLKLDTRTVEKLRRLEGRLLY